MTGAGNGVNAGNSIGACVAGSGGKAGRDCGVSGASADALDIAGHVNVEVLRVQVPRSCKECERLLMGVGRWRWGRQAAVGRSVGLALEKDAAVGEDFTLVGSAVFRWDEHVPWFAERNGLEFGEARLPESNFFEFDLGKIKGLLGYEARHDVRSVVETAQAMFRGEETGVLRTGLRYGRVESS